MLFLGYDVGSSSVKATLMDGEKGKVLFTSVWPMDEMPIDAPKPEWAEQDPAMWWNNLVTVTHKLLEQSVVKPEQIRAIGISYQMHGLVLIDKKRNVLRSSIIWCDSRAVETGRKAFDAIGEEKCLDHLLNSPGNFTASKLAWVKKNEPEIYEKTWKFLLPGDYIAMKMTGEVSTTIPGLSEGIFWDFKENDVSSLITDYFGFDLNLFPGIVPVFGEQGTLSEEAARELGLSPGTPVTYRAGDQPNNAFSLNVLNPGELAATAGTSGVIYGVSDQKKYDPLSRVNTFVHVNHHPPENRYGVLLCINGTGILNAWLRKNISEVMSYPEMNEEAAAIPVGAEGLVVLPFGNGAERILNNRNPGALFSGLEFNVHSRGHMFRAAQEGIAFAFRYGLEIMKETGIKPEVIRAGHSNMFLSPVFAEAVANSTNTPIELFDTDGSQGAALAAGLGGGFYHSPEECFRSLTMVRTVEPLPLLTEQYEKAYRKWNETLMKMVNPNAL